MPSCNAVSRDSASLIIPPAPCLRDVGSKRTKTRPVEELALAKVICSLTSNSCSKASAKKYLRRKSLIFQRSRPLVAERREILSEKQKDSLISLSHFFRFMALLNLKIGVLNVFLDSRFDFFQCHASIYFSANLLIQIFNAVIAICWIVA